MNNEPINSYPELPNPENQEPELYFEVAEASLCKKGINNKHDETNECGPGLPRGKIVKLFGKTKNWQIYRQTKPVN